MSSHKLCGWLQSVASWGGSAEEQAVAYANRLIAGESEDWHMSNIGAHMARCPQIRSTLSHRNQTKKEAT